MAQTFKDHIIAFFEQLTPANQDEANARDEALKKLKDAETCIENTPENREKVANMLNQLFEHRFFLSSDHIKPYQPDINPRALDSLTRLENTYYRPSDEKNHPSPK